MIRTSFASKTAEPRTGLRNWESDIARVSVESCDRTEDPVGYRAVFYFARNTGQTKSGNSFAVGASFLTQREKQLVDAGFRAPMTHHAIEEIENRLGHSLKMERKPAFWSRKIRTHA